MTAAPLVAGVGLSLVAGRRLDPRVLLLSGVVVGSFAGALMSAIIVLSSASEVRNAFLWLLGGFGAASWQALGVFAAYAVLPLAAIGLSAEVLDYHLEIRRRESIEGFSLVALRGG